MKKIIIAILVCITPGIILAQCDNQYQLDLSDPTTFSYDASCSDANPAQWDVKNDSCYIETSLITVASSGEIPISILINLSGNLECDDLAWIQYNIAEAGFVTDTIIRGCDHASVFSYEDTITMIKSQSLQIRIIGKSNHVTEVWQVKNGSISVCAEAIVTLPIELVDFTANSENNKVTLSWTTATEINNDYFLIERSDNGINFSPVARVKGAGNSHRNIQYSEEDEITTQGTYYYRLKQVDYNGLYSYSDIVVVSILESKKICELNVNPNPCIGRCDILFNNCGGENMQDVMFSVFDALGNVIYNSASKNLDDGNALFSFDVTNNLKPGIYIVKGKGYQKNLDKKVILGN